ncbi:MAG: fibronectin type III domain-containing protein [Paludibacteraceae bacterium]|nr:fibronectin type III domain-containing protein [Paludibacteraceae bacterium]
MKKILLLALMCLMATGGFAELVVLDRLQSGSTKTLHNGDVVTGKLQTNVILEIADGATITLRNAIIAPGSPKYADDSHSGIHCNGSATILLEGSNYVYPYGGHAAGIFVEKGGDYYGAGNNTIVWKQYTLTIDAAPGASVAKLDVIANLGAAIGAGHKYYKNVLSSHHSCGSIVINGGEIFAYSNQGAGIGGAHETSCGDITINGGKVTAISFKNSAAIGSGWHQINAGSNYWSECGTIIINGGEIIASAGSYAAGIGSGHNGICGPIYINSGVTSLHAEGYHAIGKGYFDEGKTYAFGGLTLFNSYLANGQTIAEYDYPEPIAPSVICQVPTNVQKQNITASTATISWNTSASADRYQVCYRVAASMSEEYQSVFVPDGTSCVLENLIPGTQYQVWVVAYCGDGSVTTTRSTFTTAGSQDPELLCPVPTDLVVFAMGTDEATLNWYPGSEEQSTWYVYYRKKGTSSWSEEMVTGGLGKEQKRFTLYNLEPNTTYQVYITGTCYVKSIGYWVDNTSASNQIEFTTEALGCITPSDVEVSEITASKATLTWAPGSESQDQWYVSLKKHSDSSWEKVEFDVNRVILWGLQPNTSYDVKVSSQCGSAESTPTAVTTFTTGAPGQGIEEVQGDKVQSTKVLRDGQLYIVVGDKMYDARGVEVR